MKVKIKPYKNNAKRHSDKQVRNIAKIIAQLGWRQPITVNEKGVIISGHGRYLAYKMYGKEMKIKEPWVMCNGKTIMGKPDTRPLTKEEEIMYRVADNTVVSNDYDLDIIKIEKLNIQTAELQGLMDFQLNTFNPKLSPQANKNVVTDRDIDKAEDSISQSVSGVKSKIISVMCPKCYEEFDVNA